MKSVSLTVKAAGLALLVGGVLWVALDYQQGRDIQALFFQQLEESLQVQAGEDRVLFDRHIQAHQKAAKLIVSQKRFHDYISQADWKQSEVIEHKRIPKWLPSASVMRAFFPARYALLIDPEGKTREIYYSVPEPLPAAVREPSNLLQQLSHNQAYMAMVEGTPYVFAAQVLENDFEEVLGRLLLISPIDSQFLVTGEGDVHPGVVVALLSGKPLTVLASNNPQAVPAGTLVDSLTDRYIRTSTSGFFDYGASGLEIQFVSFIATENAYQVAEQVLAKAKEQRAMMALTLVLSFAVLTFMAAHRLKTLTRQITHFSRESLGVETAVEGDEISRISGSFAQLKDSIQHTIARANAIAGGEYDRDERHHSEQDQLGRALTDMNDTLQAQAAALRQEREKLRHANEALQIFNQELEQRVKERTVELEQANQELHTALDTVQQTQKQLVEAEKMAALGGLVAGVAHEINTPLGVSVTAASTLDERTKDFSKTFDSGQLKKSELRKYLTTATETGGIILNNLQRAAELIRSFKQIAVDQTSLELREFNVRGYLEEILLSLRPNLKKTRHQVEIHCPADLVLYTHPGHFSQVITNFIMNSLAHAYDEEEAGHLVIDVSPAGERLQFHYHDDGKGIPSEHLAKIFEPFFTTARGRGGSGLGLAVIYNLITQNLGGQVHCESQVGEGTSFYFDVPISKDE